MRQGKMVLAQLDGYWKDEWVVERGGGAERRGIPLCFPPPFFSVPSPFLSISHKKERLGNLSGGESALFTMKRKKNPPFTLSTTLLFLFRLSQSVCWR